MPMSPKTTEIKKSIQLTVSELKESPKIRLRKHNNIIKNNTFLFQESITL